MSVLLSSLGRWKQEATPATVYQTPTKRSVDTSLWLSPASAAKLNRKLLKERQCFVHENSSVLFTACEELATPCTRLPRKEFDHERLTKLSSLVELRPQEQNRAKNIPKNATQSTDSQASFS